MSTWSSPSGLLTRAVKELPSVSLVTRSTWANTLMIIVTLSTLEKLLKMIIVMVAFVVVIVQMEIKDVMVFLKVIC